MPDTQSNKTEQIIGSLRLDLDNYRTEVAQLPGKFNSEVNQLFLLGLQWLCIFFGLAFMSLLFFTLTTKPQFVSVLTEGVFDIQTANLDDSGLLIIRKLMIRIFIMVSGILFILAFLFSRLRKVAKHAGVATALAKKIVNHSLSKVQYI